MRSLNCFSLPVKSALPSKQRTAHSTYPFSQWVKSREKQPLWSHKSIFSSLWNNLINSRQELSSSTKPRWLHMQRITQSPAWDCLGLVFHPQCSKYCTIIYNPRDILVRQVGGRDCSLWCWSHASNRAEVWQMKYNQQVIQKTRTLKSSLWVCFLLTFNTIWFFV